MNNVHTHKNFKGFSLIELMVVIAIIGIIGAIAMPAYQQYVIRSRVTNGMHLLETYKVPIAESYTLRGTMPQNTSEFTDPKPKLNPDYMDKIDLVYAADSLQIRLWFKDMDEASDKNITLYATLSGDDLEFTCTTSGTSSERLDTKFLPSSCKSGDEVFGGAVGGATEESVDSDETEG